MKLNVFKVMRSVLEDDIKEMEATLDLVKGSLELLDDLEKHVTQDHDDEAVYQNCVYCDLGWEDVSA